MSVQLQIRMTCFMMGQFVSKKQIKKKRKDQVMYKAPDILSKSDLQLPENPNKTKEKMGQKERRFWGLAGLVQKAQTGQSIKKKKNKIRKEEETTTLLFP